MESTQTASANLVIFAGGKIPQKRGPKGHCRSPENNDRIKKLTSEWNKK